jgi:hypothetical protein
MFPHDGVGGWTPMPRNDSADSVGIAPATPSVAATRIGASVFGRMWRNMIRPVPAPWARAAAMKSRSFSDSVSARTRRATPIHPVSPMMTMMFRWRADEAANRMRKNVKLTSTNRIGFDAPP